MAEEVEVKKHTRARSKEEYPAWLVTILKCLTLHRNVLAYLTISPAQGLKVGRWGPATRLSSFVTMEAGTNYLEAHELFPAPSGLEAGKVVIAKVPLLREIPTFAHVQRLFELAPSNVPQLKLNRPLEANCGVQPSLHSTHLLR